MPVHKEGSGYRYGTHGKLYRGKNAKAKAEKQAKAIYASGYRENPKSIASMSKVRMK